MNDDMPQGLFTRSAFVEKLIYGIPILENKWTKFSLDFVYNAQKLTPSPSQPINQRRSSDNSDEMNDDTVSVLWKIEFEFVFQIK